MQNIIEKYHIKAKKSLWQNFLVNENILKEISEVFLVQWQNIIEVWPWYGALTEKLLEKNPKSLTLVELDREMIAILEDRIKNGDFKNPDKITIENVDVLEFFPKNLEKYFVIANIPYSITSPILRHFLYETEKIPEKMLILMQKDVWDKILLGQNNAKKIKNSVLSLFVAKKCRAKEVIFVWRQNFIPAPKVESSVLLFEKIDDFKWLDDKIFFEFNNIPFMKQKKKLFSIKYSI